MRLVRTLEGFGLVESFALDGRRRLAASDRGLVLLAKRDRTSVGLSKERFSVALRELTEPLHWRNVVGRRTRQLLRNLEHTDGVHAFLAELLTKVRTEGWEVTQLDPPHRSSRYFRSWGRRYAIHPDAFGVLHKGGLVQPFFLELERRAVRPATMEARLAPYLRYYATHRPNDDNGVRPTIFVAFQDDLAATHFWLTARRLPQSKKVQLPLTVVHT